MKFSARIGLEIGQRIREILPGMKGGATRARNGPRTVNEIKGRANTPAVVAATFPVRAKFAINAIALAVGAVINPRRDRRLQVRSAKERGARTAELMQLGSFGVAESGPCILGISWKVLHNGTYRPRAVITTSTTTNP